MAVSICLRLGKSGSNVKGESQITGHKDEIDVLSWSWGMTQSGTAHRATGAGSGSADVHDLTITKYVDMAHPILMQECFNGTDFSEALLTFIKVGGKGNPVEYLKITMSGTVIISSVTPGGASGGDDSFTETVTLNFAQAKIDYTSQTANQGKGATVSGNFDIAKKFG